MVSVCFALAGALLLRGVDRAARTEARVQAELLARSLAGSFAVSLARGQHEIIQRQIDQISEQPEFVPHVERIAVIDQAGIVVAHSDPTRFGEKWDGAVAPGLDIVEDRGAGRSIVLVRTPVETALRFGTVEVALSVEGPFEEARRTSRAVLGLLAATVVVLTSVLLVMLHRVVVAPLRRLARAAREYKVGQPSLGVPAEGPDEMRTLVNAFDDLAARQSAHTGDLERAVEARTGELRDALDRLRTANRQLQALAVTDGLTGLSNRRAFNDRIGLEIERARRSGSPLSLVLFDLDHFKRLNDTLGHLEGDAALVTLARVLREGRRSVDLVARYGGEEFALILPDTKHEDALVVAERLREATVEARLPADCTVSAGVATLPDQAEDARSLVAAADDALYAAKHAGRNLVRSAGAPPEVGAVAR